MDQLDKIFELCSRIEAKINEIHDELDKLGVPKVDRETGEDIEEDNDSNSGDNTNVTYDREIVFKYNDTSNNNESYIYDINRSK